MMDTDVKLLSISIIIACTAVLMLFIRVAILNRKLNLLKDVMIEDMRLRMKWIQQVHEDLKNLEDRLPEACDNDSTRAGLMEEP